MVECMCSCKAVIFGRAPGQELVAHVHRLGVVCSVTTHEPSLIATYCFCSALLSFQLTVFIGIRAGECAVSEGVPAGAVNLWPEDGWSGALQAIPIYICAFGCHFNVLPVHGELAKPTRERLHRLVSRLDDSRPQRPAIFVRSCSSTNEEFRIPEVSLAAAVGTILCNADIAFR